MKKKSPMFAFVIILEQVILLGIAHFIGDSAGVLCTGILTIIGLVLI